MVHAPIGLTGARPRSEVYFAAVQSLDLPEPRRGKLLELHRPDPGDRVRHDVGALASMLDKDPIDLTRMVSAWMFNAWDVPEVDRGLVMLIVLAGIAHSCEPNCALRVRSNGVWELYALVDIASEDELT